MTVTTVTKRAGNAVPYDRSKILNAITSASKEYVHPMTALEIDTVTKSVEEAFGDRTEISVEEIQDLVEKQLLAHGHYDIARRYITYRQRHAQRRRAQKHLMESYRDIFFADAVDSDLKRDNANINTDASMGIMLKLGAEGRSISSTTTFSTNAMRLLTARTSSTSTTRTSHSSRSTAARSIF